MLGIILYLFLDFVLSSEKWACLLEGHGNIQVSQEESATSILQTNDGGYLVLGVSDELVVDSSVIVKYNSSQRFEWGTRWNHGNHHKTYAVIELSSGGYMVTGSYFGSYENCLLARIDSTGDILWAINIFLSTYTQNICTDIVETISGAIIISGYALEGAKWNIIYMRYDILQTHFWTMIIEDSTYDLRSEAMVATEDDCFIIIGSRMTPTTTEFFVGKYGSGGDEQYSRLYSDSTPGGVSLEVNDIWVPEDLTYFAITGKTNKYSTEEEEDLFVIVLSNDATTINWCTTFGNISTTTRNNSEIVTGRSITGITFDDNEGFIAVGDLSDNDGFNSDALMVKFDLLGNINWSKTFSKSSSPRTDFANYVIETKNEKNIVVVGGATDFITSDLNMFFSFISGSELSIIGCYWSDLETESYEVNNCNINIDSGPFVSPITFVGTTNQAALGTTNEYPITKEDEYDLYIVAECNPNWQGEEMYCNTTGCGPELFDSERQLCYGHGTCSRFLFVLQFFGFCLQPPRVGIVMEFCENGDLNHYMNQYPMAVNNKNGERLSFDERMRFLEEISNALTYLHSKSIIHRDIKLENVLLDKSLSCKLMDFGLSLVVDRMSAVKTKKIGTSYFMAPELIMGRGDYDEKVDVFAFSICCFIILTDIFHPYGLDVMNIELRVANNPLYRPDLEVVKVDEHVPKIHIQWIKKLIEETWDHEPLNRPSFTEISNLFKKKLKDKDNNNTPRSSSSNITKKEQKEERRKKNRNIVNVQSSVDNDDDEKSDEEESEEEEEEKLLLEYFRLLEENTRMRKKKVKKRGCLEKEELDQLIQENKILKEEILED